MKITNMTFKWFAVLVLAFGIAESVSAQSLLPTFGSARSGTSGFQFTKIAVDPRGAAMGNSTSADAMDVSALYWNPALASQIKGNQLMVSHTSYFIDINQNYLGYVHQLGSMAFGVSLQYLDSGEMEETTEFRQTGTGRTFKTIHYSLGLTVSQRLTEYFSYGLTARWLDERIEEITIQTGAVDFGFFYKVAETGLRFSVSVNNFGLDANPSGSTERLTLDEGVREETDLETVSPPTSFIMGSAYDAYENERWKWVITAQVSKPSDNAERLSVGSEVTFMKQFFMRAGYEFGVEEFYVPSVGFGYRQNLGTTRFDVDVSYTTYENLGDMPRFAMKFTF